MGPVFDLCHPIRTGQIIFLISILWQKIKSFLKFYGDIFDAVKVASYIFNIYIHASIIYMTSFAFIFIRLLVVMWLVGGDVSGRGWWWGGGGEGG